MSKLGVAAELNEADLHRALTEGNQRQVVLDDEELAQRLGVSGVPAIAIRPTDENLEKAIWLQGAQPYQVVLEAIEGLAFARGR